MPSKVIGKYHGRYTLRRVGSTMVVQVQLGNEQVASLRSGCKGMDSLLGWLEDLNQRPGLEELEERLQSAPIAVEHLESCVGYADHGYQRNIVQKTEHYEIVIICWKPGQMTRIHDHKGSDCAFKIVTGTASETVFQIEDGVPVESEAREYLPGEVCASAEADIHRVNNNGEGSLINLHIYTPPLKGYNVYD